MPSAAIKGKKRPITIDDLLKRQEESSTRALKRQKVVHLSRKPLEEEDDDFEQDQERSTSLDGAGGSETSETDDEDEESGSEIRDESVENGSVGVSDEDVQQDEDKLPPLFEASERLDSFIKKKFEPLPAARKRPQTTARLFASFGISPTLLAALTSMSIKVPTEVQMACIPPLLAGACRSISTISMG